MKHQYVLDRATESQLLCFKRSFLKDAENLAVCDSTPAKELHAARSEVRKLAQGLLDTAKKDQRNLTDDEKHAFDVCTYLLDDIQCVFDTRDEIKVVTDSINRAMGITSNRSATCLENWTDLKTGKAVPVLGRDHHFSDHVQRTGNEISSRDYFAALIGHPVSREVRDAMGTGNDTKGGFMVPEFLSAQIIDLLRAKNVVTQAGALTIPLPAPSCRVCKITSDPVASWVPENSLIPDTDMSIGAVDFNAHKLTCLVKVSRELMQDAGNAGSVIQNAIATAMALELDSAALMGDGVGKPQGIFKNTDINTYTLGTGNGAKLSGFDDLLYGVREIVNVNGPLPNAALLSPRTLVDYSLLKDAEGVPLIRPSLVNNIQFYDTTKIPNNQTVGTSSDCSSILLGTYSNLVIGIRSVLEIQVLMEKFADYGQIGFLATMRADTAVYQPKAFCKIVGVRS